MADEHYDAIVNSGTSQGGRVPSHRAGEGGAQKGGAGPERDQPRRRLRQHGMHPRTKTMVAQPARPSPYQGAPRRGVRSADRFGNRWDLAAVREAQTGPWVAGARGRTTRADLRRTA